MKLLLLTYLLAVLLALAAAQPTNARDAVVEIEKQRLVRFPDDDNRQLDFSNQTDKHDEAQRILNEIAKINEAFGYTKKQPVQQKLPPILDSSQYLFPKPAYHPFHSQKHQMEGSHGETLLLPSIRSLKFERQRHRLLGEKDTLAAYNVPPIKHNGAKSNEPPRLAPESDQLQYQLKVQQPVKYYYRPNQVHVPAPETPSEQQQLPTHFVIPVHLYKLNKEEYVQRHAPREYRIKGYKIVGDIDNFYGKAKNKQKLDAGNKLKHKSTPKYHLFLVPSEMVLSQQAAQGAIEKSAGAKEQDAMSLGENSREEKLAGTLRPLRIQTSSTTSSNPNINATSSSAQIVKKRILPKPIRNKETNVESVAVQQQPSGHVAISSSTIRITPPPIVVSTNSGNLNGNGNKKPYQLGNIATMQPASSVTNMFNLTAKKNSTNTISTSNTSNAIKTAFQNIFRFPFRPQPKPAPVPVNALSDSSSELQTVPLQIPQKTNFFAAAAQQFLPQPLYSADNPNIPNSNMNTNQMISNDYKWEDESASNSAAEEEGDMDEGFPLQSPLEEKHIFAHHHKNQQETQQEALKQGGIIIQRLKVRKGGIAIAGPGGVATAGSGGTAIVGPGGYALTHPRSLTIAGPGAKIIAIPSNVDLKDALQRTNLAARLFPREGKIVATGPAVYYAPGTGTGLDMSASSDS